MVGCYKKTYRLVIDIISILYQHPYFHVFGVHSNAAYVDCRWGQHLRWGLQGLRCPGAFHAWMSHEDEILPIWMIWIGRVFALNFIKHVPRCKSNTVSSKRKASTCARSFWTVAHQVGKEKFYQFKKAIPRNLRRFLRFCHVFFYLWRCRDGIHERSTLCSARSAFLHLEFGEGLDDFMTQCLARS